MLRNTYRGEETVISLIHQGLLEIPFNLQNEAEMVNALMQQYQNVPMSLADACLVRMSELISGSSILTLDSDFRIYRQNKNEMINLIIADGI